MQKLIFKLVIMCLTRRMRRLCLSLLFLPVVLLQTGCSSDTGTTPSANNVDANGQPVSSVPWNKPEQWEQNGQLGGLAQ